MTVVAVWVAVAAGRPGAAAPPDAGNDDGAAATAPPAPDAPPAKPVLTKPPRLSTFVEAEYPPAEKAAGRTASVVLQLTIAADGTVADAQVATSGGAVFDAAAVVAARRFVFAPAEIDGRPAAIRILYRYDFVIAVERHVKATADLTGVVRERATHRPLGGITLAAGGKRAITGVDGRFALADLPPGRQVVALAGPGVTALQAEEALEAGRRTDVIYDVSPEEKSAPGEQDDLEIVVVAPPLQKAIASVTVAAEQGRRVPGTQGDVLKVVESLPGVARAATGSGALVVWGAAPQDTRVYVDGVRLPTLYHAGGLRSVIAGDLVRSIELLPGGYGPTYGRGLGGIVVVDSAPLEGDGTHGAVTADVIDAAAVVRAKLAPGLRAAVALRDSYLDRSFDLASSRDVGDLFPIPKYRDGQLRLSYAVGADARVEAVGLFSNDQVARTVTTSDPGFSKRDQRDLSFYRAWVRYRQGPADGAAVDVVSYFGVDRARLVNQFGGPEASQDTDSTLYGFRGVWRGRASRRVTLSLGLDAEVVTSALDRTGSVNIPAREGDVRVFGQIPPDQVNTDTWRTLSASAAPYAELDVALAGDRLHLVPGLRVEPYVTGTSRITPAVGDTPAIGLFQEDTAVEPRFTARVAASPRLRLNASYGVYHQAPQPEDLSAVFGNPTLPVSRSTHYVLGAALRLADALTAEVTLFHAASSALAARSPLPSPALAQALVPFGTGNTTGGQIVLRREPVGRFFGWVSYSLMRAERREPVLAASGAAGGAFQPGPARLFDFDQTHLLTAVGSYDLGRGFEVGLRVRYATGFPRTPVVGAVYDLRRDSYQPIFGAQSSIRLPAFFQADARVARRWRFDGGTLEVSLDVQNVTDRANAEDFVYSVDYQQRRTITGLPILPVLGARYAW
jgi:TonB family protein